MATKKGQKRKMKVTRPAAASKERKRSVKPKSARSKSRSGKRAISVTTGGPIVTGVGGTGVVVPPVVLTPIGNFFDAGRPGHAVVRPTDLVALRLQFQNLVVT